MLSDKILDKFTSFWSVIKLNCRYIFQNTLHIAGTAYTVATIILAFVSWNDLKITSTTHKIFALLFIFVGSFILAGIYTLFFKKSKTLWSRGSGSVQVRYMDILKLAFSKSSSSKKIIVIPVNTNFDTIVDTDLSAHDKPLVSEKSLHGQWVNAMISHGYTREELNQKIQQSLSLTHITPCYTKGRSPGNPDFYPFGSTAILRYNQRVTFFLLALSEFDDDNVAYCSPGNYLASLAALIDCYIQHGQGYDIYIPLMGTNLSKARLSHKEAMDKIVSILKLRENQLFGKITVVVYPKDRKYVTILDA